MSDKYAALKQAAEKAQLESKDEWGYDTEAFHDEATPETILELLAERDADRARIAELEDTMEREREKSRRMVSRVTELEAREIKPAQGEVLVTVTGYTGCGKSAIAGEIEIAMKAIGVPVEWTNGDAEKRMTGADWLTAIEMYKPRVRILEVNQPRSAGISLKIEGE